jgi:hypothetical protein
MMTGMEDQVDKQGKWKTWLTNGQIKSHRAKGQPGR